MSKYIKIVLILGGISLLLTLYIVFSVQQVTVTSEKTANKTESNYEKNEVEKISLEQIEENYQASIGAFWNDYEEILEDVKSLSFKEGEEKTPDNISTTSNPIAAEKLTVSSCNDKIVKLKIEALSYTVPTQYKDMHLKLVMSLSFLKNYLDTQADAHKERALSLYMEVKNEYQKL